MKKLTADIKAKARELGFSLVRIAKAEVLVPEGNRLQEWLGRGRHASMTWMEREVGKRSNLQNVLPGVRSVVCVAMNYFSPVRHSTDPRTAKISRYAWGDDYHIVLHERLEQLWKFIKIQSPSSASRFYVDTGPVMEKAWAVRAGIGWLGKHTNVISREFGSWIFLGEILLDIELEADTPIEDFCGTCTACIDACPTKAIAEPYSVDSRLCISYLTIEHRGELPEALAGAFDRWVFGCDICQDVCPWNKFEKPTVETAFRPRGHTISPLLKELAALTKETFEILFRRSPVKRTKLEGLRRNARFLLPRSDG